MLATGDFPKAWEAAEAASSDISASFWRNFRTYGLGSDFSYTETVSRRLLEAKRPGAALEMLLLYRGQNPKENRADLIASSLEELLRSAPESQEIRSLSPHDLLEAFSLLVELLPPSSSDRLRSLEWAYLAIFDHEASPPALSRYLAESPTFFVEVLSCIYRPHLSQDDESSQHEPDTEADEGKKALARNAYRLLSNWRTLPGTRVDGSIDGDFFKKWVLDARQLLRSSRRLEAGDLHIGFLLAGSPTAPDGSWPCIEVRELLEDLQSPELEDGLSLRIHNDRGVTTRGLLDGGSQELELAAQYRQQAAPFADRWPRTSAVLRGLAEDYEREARRHEEEAERHRKGFET